MSEFDKYIGHIYLWEGGYVDHPKDPGGATNMGITLGTLSSWRGYRVSKQEVKDLTREEADTIYKERYWDVVRGDDLPEGVNYAVFDAAVNSGPRASIKWLQRASGVYGDGILGPITLGAIEDATDPLQLALRAIEYRERFLRRLGTWDTFGRGWLNRLNHVRDVVRGDYG